MRIPPNYGLTYTSDFAQMYKDLSKLHDVPRIPFLLEESEGKPKFNLLIAFTPTPRSCSYRRNRLQNPCPTTSKIP